MPDEGTEAVVTNAQCSNHLWIADRRNITFSQSDEIKRIVASSRLNNLVPVIEIVSRILCFTELFTDLKRVVTKFWGPKSLFLLQKGTWVSRCFRGDDTRAKVRCSQLFGEYFEK